MSTHVCAKCGKQGETVYEQGQVHACLAICGQQDCPQRNSLFKELFGKMPVYKPDLFGSTK